ncbi:MAG TPA: sugar phosphate isomerase/epimerase family protein [Candidatus Acidoferrales bacterium]|nr:sugar phosphate isomerase/epimerase family protein [Candidatus Acidoferrales bacterium]
MQRILSTYRYVSQPLTHALLAEIAGAGISGVEIFCGSFHFNYGSAQSVREIAGTLNELGLHLHALHAPTERDSSQGRGSGLPVSISEPERIRRQEAVDEVKRALDVAETIPFRYLVQHLGSSRQAADSRNRDAAFGSLEHLAAFAKQRGVTIALENTPSEIGAPASLLQFVKETHLRDLRFCFDVGHAHLDGGVDADFSLMRDLVVTTHVHDNHGEKDEHLLPYEGGIDWDAAFTALASAPEMPALVLELKEQTAGAPALEQIRAVFDKLEKHLDKKGIRPART